MTHAMANQLDIFDHDPARLAKANRAAAAAALVNPYATTVEQRERHDYYIREAMRLERLASAQRIPRRLLTNINTQFEQVFGEQRA